MKRGHPKFALRQGTVMEVIPGLGFLCTCPTCTIHFSSSVMLPSSQTSGWKEMPSVVFMAPVLVPGHVLWDRPPACAPQSSPCCQRQFPELCGGQQPGPGL